MVDHGQTAPRVMESYPSGVEIPGHLPSRGEATSLESGTPGKRVMRG